MDKSDKQDSPLFKIIFMIGLTGFYFLTRATGLDLIPIFTDEAMYIHIAQIINDNWENLFLTKVNAFKPLFIWLTAAVQNIVSEPLLAGRWVSVFAGFFSIIGIYVLGRDIFSERVGKVSAVIYLFCPYFVFYERMALMESLVNVFGVWAVWISFRISKQISLDKSYFIVLGFLLGLAFFTKTTALLFFPAPFIIFIASNTYFKKNFYNYLGLTLFLVALINFPYFITESEVGFNSRHPIFSAAIHYISLKTLLGFPVEIWGRNLWSIYVYFMIYLTFPIVLVLGFGVFNSFLVKNKTAITLLLLFFIPLSIITLIGSSIYSRYYLVIASPLIVLTGWALVELSNKVAEKIAAQNNTRENVIASLLLICVVSEGIVFTHEIGKDPLKALLPNVDHYQYLTSYVSGYGIKEAAEFLISKSEEGPIDVMTSWSQGNPQDGIMVYLWKKPNINIIPALWWPKQKPLFPKGDSFPLYPSKYQSTTLEKRSVADLRNIFFILPFRNNLRNYFTKSNPEWKKVWNYSKLDDEHPIEIYKLSR
jgi:hypothetical protein